MTLVRILVSKGWYTLERKWNLTR